MPTDYTYLLDEYPSEISMNQLYRICHYSKRKCSWLLENGYIPCIDSGKKTHRFKIKTVDVVSYLMRLESNSDDASPLAGLFSSKCKYIPKENPISAIPCSQISAHLSLQWSKVFDALRVSDIIKLTGYSAKTVNRWLQNGQLKYVSTLSGRIIAKDWLIEWMAEYSHQNAGRLSTKHRQMIEELIKPGKVGTQ